MDSPRLQVHGEMGSYGSGSPDIWGKFWKLKIPPKCRHFFWKEFLPVRMNLRKRKLDVEEECRRCGSGRGRESDTTIHALFSYLFLCCCSVVFQPSLSLRCADITAVSFLLSMLMLNN